MRSQCKLFEFCLLLCRETAPTCRETVLARSKQTSYTGQSSSMSFLGRSMQQGEKGCVQFRLTEESFVVSGDQTLLLLACQLSISRYTDHLVYFY